MKQRIDIIPAQLCHFSQIVAIEALCFADPWTEAALHQALEHSSNPFWCAVCGNAVAGFLILSRTGDDWSIDDLAVHPSYRRQGIARQLLTTAHSQYSKARFLLEVRQSNTAAIALYQSMGYIPTGFRKRYYTCPEEGAVLMDKMP